MSCQEELKSRSIEALTLAKQSSKAPKRALFGENAKVASLAKDDFKRHTLPYSIKPIQASTLSDRRTGIKEIIDRLLRGSKILQSQKTKADLSPFELHSQSIALFLDLKKMAELRFGDSQLTKETIEFVEELIYRLEYNPELFGKGVVLSAVIGKLICLVDKRPKEVHLLVDKSDLKQAVDKIQTEFQKCLERASVKIQVEYQSHLASNLGDADIAKNVLIASTIAKFLIPATGSVNYAIAQALFKHFIEERLVNTSYAQSMKSGLHMLFCEESLRRSIEEIKLPADRASPANEVVRLSLSIPKGIRLSDIHARQAAIAAMITHMRQGKGGSCFASVIGIEQQHCHMHQAVMDFKDLIHDGMLKRSVDGKVKAFPYLLKAGRDGLLDPLHIGSCGEVLNERGEEVFLLNSPALLAAFEELSIEDPGSIIRSALSDVCMTHTTFTIEDLIIEAFKNNNQDSIDRARLAFASKQSAPLLKAWENALAGMAEGENTGLLRLALRNSCIWLVERYAKKQGCIARLEQERVFERLEALLDQNVHYLYDPSPALEKSLHGESAFVLYYLRNHKDLPASWERVDSKEKFALFLKWLAFEAIKECEDKEVQEACLGDLIASDQAIGRLLKKYHRENIASKLDRGEFDDLRFTPWISFMGNDPKRLMKVYKELDHPLYEEEFFPQDALSLFKTLISKMHLLKAKKGSGLGCIPMRIQGVHTFSLIPYHQSFRPFVSLEKEYVLEFQERVLNPGQAVASSLATPALKKLLIEMLKAKWIQSDDLLRFQELLDQLPDRLTIKELRTCLVDAVRELSDDKPLEERFLREIDKTLIEALPSPLKDLWKESVVHFADTNWQVGVEDIHFAVGVNPGSGEVELFLVLEGGEVHQVLNQEEYLKDHKWELFTS